MRTLQTTVRILLCGLTLSIPLPRAFAIDATPEWNGLNQNQCDFSFLQGPYHHAPSPLRAYASEILKALPDSGATIQDVQASFVAVANSIDQNNEITIGHFKATVRETFIPKMKEKFESMENLGFKPDLSKMKPVQGFFELANLARRVQTGIIKDISVSYRLKELLIGELKKRKIAATETLLDDANFIAQKTSELQLQHYYAELISRSFDLKQWEGNVQRSLTMDTIADTEWKITQLTPVFEGFMGQLTDANLGGIRNADQSMPKMVIHEKSDLASQNILTVELRNWGKKDKTVNISGAFRPSIENGAPARIEFDSPTYDDISGG